MASLLLTFCFLLITGPSLLNSTAASVLAIAAVAPTAGTRTPTAEQL